MEIPVSSTMGFIGVIMFGFGLFLILAGLEIFTIQQVTVKKGPKTWGLGIGIVLLGLVLLYPEIVNQSNSTPEENASAKEPTDMLGIVAAEQGEDDASGWHIVKFTVPNDGVWTEAGDGSYSAGQSKTDTFAWSEEIVDGDFTLKIDVESTFDNYGAGLVVVYGDGQGWSNGCLIFGITGYWQDIRIDTIYRDDIWLDYKERVLGKDQYTMTIEVSGDVAKLYADDILVASAPIPINANSSGKIALVKYWESANVTYSNIQLLNP